MSEKAKTFVKGAAILSITGIVCKIIGAVFRIPLANIISPQGMAYYQLVYPIYATLLVISTAGLPAAIAKMVSERRANQDYAGAKQVFVLAFKTLLIIGVVSSILLVVFRGTVANWQGVPDAANTYLGIAPALFFVAIISAYRGYFQGMQMMAPTGFSQLVEQLVKLGVGLWFAGMFLPRGPQYGALGALLGVSISEILALIFLLIIYRVKKKQLNQEIATTNTAITPDKNNTLLKKLLVIAIPVTIGASIMPIVMAIDSAIVIRFLQGAGFSEFIAREKFGLLTGYVNPLINMPAVLSLALAMSLVPAISAFKARGKTKELREQSGLGFKIALLVGLPAAVGFSVLAEPIIKLLYSDLTRAQLTETSTLLIIMSIAVLVLTMLQTMTGILQGLGKVHIPVINLLIGAAIKIGLSIWLIRIPALNVKGAALGTVACYGVAAVLNVIFVVKHTRMHVGFMGHIIKPLACTAIMGGAVYGLYAVIYNMAGSNTLATLGAIVAGVVIYAGALLVTKTVTRQEIALIRGKA